MNDILNRIDRYVETFVVLIFAVMVLTGLLQVFNRFVLNASLSWSEELQIFGHIWVVFLGIGIAYRRGAHLSIEMLQKKYTGKVKFAFDLLVELMWLGFAAALVVLSYRVALVAANQESPGLQITMNYPYYGLVIGGVYLAVVAMRRIVDQLQGKQPAVTP